MTGMDSGKRVINGTYGRMWMNGQEVGECYGLQAKVAYKKEDIQMPGKMMTDTKLINAKGTGTVKYFKTNSRMAIEAGNAALEGRDIRFTIVSALEDPDAYGSERVAVSGVSFDDITVIDWTSGEVTRHEAPYTFAGYEYLDMIEVQ
jgi:hypothetical protein